MDMKELVSIIIPVYNGEKYIIKTLESCYYQTYKNIEVIIIDDYSHDSSIEKIKHFINDKYNFILEKNIKNLGCIETVNKGIKLSKGEKIICLGQDDILKKEHIETMLKSFKKNTSFVFCDSDYINENDEIFFESNKKLIYKEKLKDVKFSLSLENFINSCGLMFSREKALEVGGFTHFIDYPNYGEWFFWMKLSNVGNIDFVSEIKSLYRRHDTNMTNSFSEYRTKKILYKYFFECQKYSFINNFKNFILKEKIIFLFSILKTYLKFIYFKSIWILGK